MVITFGITFVRKNNNDLFFGRLYFGKLNGSGFLDQSFEKNVMVFLSGEDEK